MDTKSTKMRRLKVILIVLAILVPAMVLVYLYPRMGKVYEEKIKEIETQESEIAAEETYIEETLPVEGTDTNTEIEYLPNEEIIVEEILPSEQISEKAIVNETDEITIEVTDHAYDADEEISDNSELEVTEHTYYPVEEPAIIAMESSAKEIVSEDAEYELSSNFVNYAVEASYYLYGQILQDTRKTAINFSVLDYYGWINDYYTLADLCDLYVEYQDYTKQATNEMAGRSQSDYDLSALFLEKQHVGRVSVEEQLRTAGKLGYLILQFDEYGNISDVRFNSFGNIISYGSLYQHAKESISQYENNVSYFNQICDAGAEVDPMELRPKSFRAVYVVGNDLDFVYYRMGRSAEKYFYNPYNVFVEMGAEWLILIAVIFVALIALILPFFKKLDTGWEKIFAIPAEIVCGLICCTVGGVYLMFELMYFSCYPVLMDTLASYGPINIIGYNVAPDTIYYVMLGVNFIGWALVFFMEYICVTALRQFLFRPVYYLKNRLLIVMFFAWIVKLYKRAYHSVTDINISKGLNKSIWKIVIINALIVGVLCCFWFVGWFGVIIYSVILYVALRKNGCKMQNQYESILNVTKEMAEGNLKAEVVSDLGVFTEFGDELIKVQSGFSKAVAEEAKSQNMKTELITNVSHDLKTPLTAIITYVDLLKKDNITEEERREYIDTLDKKSMRLKVLIEDLFEVSKATSNNIILYCTDMDLVNLLKQVCLENEDKIADSNLEFRWNLPEQKCVSYLDPNRTYRIMDNLIQNILKYSMPHSRVYIDMEEQEEEYVIRFKNMSAVEMNFDVSEITERFVRGDLSRNTEGSGLGLAIAQSFTELQGGKFEIEIDGDLFKVALRFPKTVKGNNLAETE